MNIFLSIQRKVRRKIKCSEIDSRYGFPTGPLCAFLTFSIKMVPWQEKRDYESCRYNYVLVVSCMHWNPAVHSVVAKLCWKSGSKNTDLSYNKMNCKGKWQTKQRDDLRLHTDCWMALVNVERWCFWWKKHMRMFQCSQWKKSKHAICM